MIEMHVLGLERLRAKLRPGLVREPAATMVADAGAFALRDVRDGSRGLGAISSSFVATASGLTAKVVSLHPGALPMEFGRRPGRRMPAAAALRGWAAAHGLGGHEFVIARAIQRRGIKGRFFLRRTKDRLRSSELPRLVRIARDRIVGAWEAP